MKLVCKVCDYEEDRIGMSYCLGSGDTDFPPCPECGSEDTVWRVEATSGAETAAPHIVYDASDEPLMEFGPLSCWGWT